VLALDQRSEVLRNVYISLPYIVAARKADTDRNEEITSLSLYVYRIFTLYVQQTGTRISQRIVVILQPRISLT